MVLHSVIPCGAGMIAIYSISKQTYVSAAITNNVANRKKLQAQADKLNSK